MIKKNFLSFVNDQLTFHLLFSLLGLLLSGCATTSGKKLSSEEKARLFVEIGNGALSEGDPTGALQSFAQAEAEDDRLPELHHSKALAYYGKQDMQAAMISAKHAIELRPLYADANNTLGKLLMEQGKTEDAISRLLVAARDPLYRESYKAWTNLGILEYRRQNMDRARHYFDQAIVGAPLLACIAFYYRGNIYLKQSRTTDAIHDYVSASQKACTSFGQAHLALSMAYEQNKQFQLARKTLLDIQERYPHTQLAEKAVQQLKRLP